MSQERANEAAHQELYAAGDAMRRKVLGDAWVNARSAGTPSNFMKSMTQLATEVAWGSIWTRPGLAMKERCLIAIAIMAEQGREAELGANIRGAVNNGATEAEIRETIMQVAIYAGMPTGMVAGRVADQAFKQLKEEGALPK